MWDEKIPRKTTVTSLLGNFAICIKYYRCQTASLTSKFILCSPWT